MPGDLTDLTGAQLEEKLSAPVFVVSEHSRKRIQVELAWRRHKQQMRPPPVPQPENSPAGPVRLHGVVHKFRAGYFGFIRGDDVPEHYFTASAARDFEPQIGDRVSFVSGDPRGGDDPRAYD